MPPPGLSCQTNPRERSSGLRHRQACHLPTAKCEDDMQTADDAVFGVRLQNMWPCCWDAEMCHAAMGWVCAIGRFESYHMS